MNHSRLLGYTHSTRTQSRRSPRRLAVSFSNCGVRSRSRAYCQQALCSPSRTSLLTGVRPDAANVWDLTKITSHHRDEMKRIPQTLRNLNCPTNLRCEKALTTLVVLTAVIFSCHADEADAPVSTAKARAAEFIEEFNAFWTTENTQPVKIPPTMANVPYGADTKQVLDFWRAKSDQSTPLVFFIHGGSWNANDKDKVTAVSNYLAAGISVVSINYRFVRAAAAAGIKPPVKWPLYDAARALQFVRSKAAEWNIDKSRIGASGGSAGACSSLWLAFHEDMADPSSQDPVARESTRLLCAGVVGAQTSLDPKQMKEWIPNITYGGHAFGLNGDKANKISPFQQFLDARDQIMPWIKEYSPYELVTGDDPPVYLYYTDAPSIGKKQRNATHSANFGVKLQERMKEAGVECQLNCPDAPPPEYPNPVEFLIAKLTAK